MILIGVVLAIHKEGTYCYMQNVNPHPYPIKTPHFVYTNIYELQSVVTPTKFIEMYLGLY